MNTAYNDKSTFAAFLIVLLLVLATLGFYWWEDERCKDSCRMLFGEEWVGRTGLYEACRCVGPEGNVKEPLW